MIKKAINSITLITLLAGSLFASTNADLQTIKEAKYYQGVRDANMVFNNNLQNPNTFDMKKKYLKGFIVFKDAKNMTSDEIIKATAIAMKLGYNVDFFMIKGDESILFAVKERLPDAKETAKKLKLFGIPTNIAKIDKEVDKINLIEKDAINHIKDFYREKQAEELKQIREMKDYIAHLEKKNKDFRILNENNKIHKHLKHNFSKNTKGAIHNAVKPTIKIVKKYVKINLKNLQVVNRILTKKYLRKHGIKNEAKVSPLSNYAKSIMTIEKVEEKKRIVARNIKQKYLKKIPKLNSFKEIYNYITKNAVITKNGSLILNGRVFNEGDRIFKKWTLAKAIYSNGVVIIEDSNKNDYHVATKR